MIAGGFFASAGGVPVHSVARWDGVNWSPLGQETRSVNAFTTFDDGSGLALYAGVSIFTAPTISGVAKWDNVQWSLLGSEMNGGVFAVTVFDDGTGPTIYAGGNFTMAGGVAANRIARWDGLTWTPLGEGLDNAVYALAVFDDGAGPALYVGGYFSVAGGIAASRIAKWDGTSWSPLSSGFVGRFYHYVSALTVFDDGTGSALYVGGDFLRAGGYPSHYLAKWQRPTTCTLAR